MDDATPATSSPSRPLVTVGHGTLVQEALGTLLVDAGVQAVVDVRRFPGSRRNPDVARDAMARWLPARGVGYRWEEALGGRRRGAPVSPHVALRNASFRAYADHMETAEWEGALPAVLAEAADRTVAILCSESVWWRCHRRLVADVVTLVHHLDVRHLMHDGRLDAHRVTDGARRAGDRVRYDNTGRQPTLFGEAGPD